mmetsp:Transcript_24390/g.46284  ORF Transcript_24390/g.46284 Transcript_24390/m.46284 type:complete len:203 (-) Transcript_24390:580-1188(-)
MTRRAPWTGRLVGERGERGCTPGIVAEQTVPVPKPPHALRIGPSQVIRRPPPLPGQHRPRAAFILCVCRPAHPPLHAPRRRQLTSRRTRVTDRHRWTQAALRLGSARGVVRGGGKDFALVVVVPGDNVSIAMSPGPVHRRDHHPEQSLGTLDAGARPKGRRRRAASLAHEIVQAVPTRYRWEDGIGLVDSWLRAMNGPGGGL